MSDLQLRQNVSDELEFEPGVDGVHIGVTAEKGVVTLTGHVSSYAEKLAALEAVRRIKGVRAIAEELDVRYPADKKTADDEIAKRAADILNWDTLVPAGAVLPSVHEGWITLKGEVGWYYQRTAAEEDVRKLSGVRGVTNLVTIKPRVEAADIKRKIENALKRHAEIEAQAVRVTVKDGNKVVLEGLVDNWDERRAAENAAWSAPGVRAVEDLIHIR